MTADKGGRVVATAHIYGLCSKCKVRERTFRIRGVFRTIQLHLEILLQMVYDIENLKLRRRKL